MFDKGLLKCWKKNPAGQHIYNTDCRLCSVYPYWYLWIQSRRFSRSCYYLSLTLSTLWFSKENKLVKHEGPAVTFTVLMWIVSVLCDLITIQLNMLKSNMQGGKNCLRVICCLTYLSTMDKVKLCWKYFDLGVCFFRFSSKFVLETDGSWHWW